MFSTIKKNVTITGCRFSKCHGDKGGGFCGFYSNVTIFDTVFEENTARIGGGAHILNSDFILISRLLGTRTAQSVMADFAPIRSTKATFLRLTP
jgi:hypothetical protein